jgi:hypothetical protein
MREMHFNENNDFECKFVCLPCKFAVSPESCGISTEDNGIVFPKEKINTMNPLPDAS